MPAHDLHTRYVLRTGLAVVAAIVACVAAVFLLLRAWDVPPGADRAASARRVPANGPSLQAAPQPDLARYRAEKQQQLESSGWVDREHGIVHVPVGVAMDLLARRAASEAQR